MGREEVGEKVGIEWPGVVNLHAGMRRIGGQNDARDIALGLQASLRVGRLMDVSHGIDPSAGPPLPQIATGSLISHLQSPIQVGERLKNCRAR